METEQSTESSTMKLAAQEPSLSQVHEQTEEQATEMASHTAIGPSGLTRTSMPPGLRAALSADEQSLASLRAATDEPTAAAESVVAHEEVSCLSCISAETTESVIAHEEVSCLSCISNQRGDDV